MQTTRDIVWLGMHLAVPEAWEIVRHALGAERGSLALADRRRQRLQVSWIRAEAEPDVKRTLSDYRADELAEDPDCKLTRLERTAGWRGFRRRGEAGTITRAGRYLAALKRWVEMVVSWPEAVDTGLERRLLEGFEVDDEADPPRRWRAFGLDIRVPPEWPLAEVSARPADASMTFRKDRRREAVVRRLGAVDAWFGGDLAAFLRNQTGPARCQVSETTYGTHEARDGRSNEAPNAVARFVRRTPERLDRAWLCPSAHAVFLVTTRGPRKDLVRPEAFAVRCCDGAPDGAERELT